MGLFVFIMSDEVLGLVDVATVLMATNNQQGNRATLAPKPRAFAQVNLWIAAICTQSDSKRFWLKLYLCHAAYPSSLTSIFGTSVK